MFGAAFSLAGFLMTALLSMWVSSMAWSSGDLLIMITIPAMLGVVLVILFLVRVWPVIKPWLFNSF